MLGIMVLHINRRTIIDKKNNNIYEKIINISKIKYIVVDIRIFKRKLYLDLNKISAVIHL